MDRRGGGGRSTRILVLRVVLGVLVVVVGVLLVLGRIGTTPRIGVLVVVVRLLPRHTLVVVVVVVGVVVSLYSFDSKDGRTLEDGTAGGVTIGTGVLVNAESSLVLHVVSWFDGVVLPVVVLAVVLGRAWRV